MIDYEKKVDINKTLYPDMALKMGEATKETLSIFLTMTSTFEDLVFKALNQGEEEMSLEDFHAKAFTKEFDRADVVDLAFKQMAIQNADLAAAIIGDLSKAKDELMSLTFDDDWDENRKREAMQELEATKIKIAGLEQSVVAVGRANALFGAYYNCEVIEDSIVFDEITMVILDKLLATTNLTGAKFDHIVKQRNEQVDAINQMDSGTIDNIMKEVIGEDDGKFKKSSLAKAVEQGS